MWFASGGSGQVELETSLQKAGEEKQELDKQLAGLNAAAWLQIALCQCCHCPQCCQPCFHACWCCLIQFSVATGLAAEECGSSGFARKAFPVEGGNLTQVVWVT